MLFSRFQLTIRRCTDIKCHYRCTYPRNLELTNDNTELARNSRLVACASKSVGIIRGLLCQGTGFRIGSCYLATARHVILRNASKQGTDQNEIDHDKVTSNCLFVEFEYMLPAKRNQGKTYTFKKICFESKVLDFIILEIKHDGEPLPPCLKISKIVPEYPLYLLGHPSGVPQKQDKIQHYALDYDFLKKSNEWAEKNGYTADDYSGIDKKGTALIHTSFKKGASGSPVIMADVYSEEYEPAAVLMLMKGLPKFYYKQMGQFTEEEKKNFLIVEQCVLLYPLLQTLKEKPEYQNLAKDLEETQIDLISRFVKAI